MGQYYHAITENEDSTQTRVYDLSVAGVFTDLKLCAHSRWDNVCLKAVCSLLCEAPLRLYWVGDYANTATSVNGLSKKKIKQLWKARMDQPGETLYPGKNMCLVDKVLVNHSKKEYLSFKEYYEKCAEESPFFLTHPVSLLTAIGNGQGGGDYYGINEESIGAWAGDLIQITDSVPEKYEEFFTYFV